MAIDITGATGQLGLLRQPIDMVNCMVGNRQPPLGPGWGIFSRRNGEISGSSALLVQCLWSRTGWAERRSIGQHTSSQ